MGVETVTWANCYDDPWQAGADIVRAAFAHPAKMAKGLLSRILTYGLGQGFWRPGDALGDPFGGIGTTGIMAAYHGLHALLVELEPKFVALAAANFALHRRRWEALGVAPPFILQGDSRRFAELVGGVAGVVTSPPYAGSPVAALDPKASGGEGKAFRKTGQSVRSRAALRNENYADSPSQIGSLPPGDVDAVVTSPPYADSVNSASHGIDPSKMKLARHRKGYGSHYNSNGNFNDPQNYGHAPGQIGALPAGPLDGAVTSPPRADVASHDPGFRAPHQQAANGRDEQSASVVGKFYGATTGQLGNASGETYWQAMAAVYAQVHAALKPRGVLAVVLKDYVKGGVRVPLCDQTATLLERLGFAVFLRCRAVLVKEWEEPSLFGGPVKRRRERKSFFRRLHEARLPEGDPRRIDHEEVLWCRRS